MSMRRFPLKPVLLVWSFLVFAAGCGGSGDTPQPGAGPSAQKSIPAPGGTKPAALPTASIGGPAVEDYDADDNDEENLDDAPLAPPPKEGTPEWLIFEIVQLKMAPMPATDDVDKLREARRERNWKIIELATEAIAQTHDAPEKESVFTAAAHRLMEARQELALQGDRESIDALYENAESFYKRDPESKAAADSAYILTQFTLENAQRFASREPQWLKEFARQARLFATNFPQETARAPALLLAAGRSCELYGLDQEATACYLAIQQDFAESPRTESVTASLRRLTLKGKPLQFAGPTIDGGFLSIDDYRGKPVLIVFWASHAKPFVDLVPQLTAVTKKYEPQGLAVLGVNLDEEEPAVDAFLEKYPIGWRQIFYSDREKRGWSNPIAVYYGVVRVPMLWLVGPDGNVVNPSVDPEHLEREIADLLKRSGPSKD